MRNAVRESERIVRTAFFIGIIQLAESQAGASV